MKESTNVLPGHAVPECGERKCHSCFAVNGCLFHPQRQAKRKEKIKTTNTKMLVNSTSTATIG